MALPPEQEVFVGFEKRQDNQLDVSEPVSDVACHVQTQSDFGRNYVSAAVKEVGQREGEVSLLDQRLLCQRGLVVGA